MIKMFEINKKEDVKKAIETLEKKRNLLKRRRTQLKSKRLSSDDIE